MSESERIVAETAERIFADLADLQNVTSAKSDGWKEKLRQTLEDNGVTLAWVSEECGGAGVSLAEGFDVIRSAGRFAIAIPLVETMLAGWLLSRAGLPSPMGNMSIAPVQPDDHIALKPDGTLKGRVRAIPFAREAEHFAVVVTDSQGLRIALVAAKDCRLHKHENLTGDSQDDVVFDGVTPLRSANAPDGFDLQSAMLMGCTARSLQICGALEAMLNRTVTYAGERVAFGKTISKFQAVQNNIARLAGEAAAATAAAGSAADALANTVAWDLGTFLEATAAKIRCSEAASSGVSIAHQVHGAIGLTKEHPLHRFTLRALSWREDFGSENYWAVELGKAIAKRGADELWPIVASR